MKHYSHIASRTVLFAAVLAIASCFSASAQRLQPQQSHKGKSVVEQMMEAPINNRPSDRIIANLLNFASTLKGTPYRSGSSSPRGFDCSGFTSYVFRQFGVNLSRSSREQVSNGRRVSRSELRPGDLVFFNGRARGNRVGHVGIVTKVEPNGNFRFIHSASSRGVSESKSTEAYYRARYVSACRVIE